MRWKEWRREKKAIDWQEWHTWFAWYPVKTIAREWVWLEHVVYTGYIENHNVPVKAPINGLVKHFVCRSLPCS